MIIDNLNKSDKECIDILKYIFRDALQFYNKIAPTGLLNSEYILFFHPTPEQQYEEHIRISENINRLSKTPKKDQKPVDIKDFKQNELTDISEYKEFLYILGLSVYDIFSNNHEVYGTDNKIYDFGSLRGSGSFIADFFNKFYPDNSEKYDYMDFYMGTIWINQRGTLTPFYEYVFQKLKDLNCDWKYFFPRLFLIDPKKILDNSTNTKIEEYKPEKAIHEQFELSDKDKETKKFQDELDKIYEDEYEEGKYKPLSQIVQAYKNIYGVLPNLDNSQTAKL